MRLFIAINFDGETKENITKVQRRLGELGHGNFSRPENLHLTLAFLDDVAPARAEAVRKAMDCTPLRPMELTFDHMGRFSRDSGDIWWIGLAENKALLELQKALSGHLDAGGFRLESRRFSPHITLAREVRLVSRPDGVALLDKPFATQAEAISLMCSQRTGGRLTYAEQYRKA